MPDNALFYYLAYAAATGIFVLYSFSLSSRRRKLRNRLIKAK